MEKQITKPAVHYFKEGFNCSQAVLAAFTPSSELETSTALKLASNFGGGMNEGETCGAVTGALMAIGLKYGRYKADDIQAKEKAAGIAREFKKRFVAKHGSLQCKKLLKYDITTEKEKILEKDLFNTLCPEFVGDAEAILKEIL